MRGTHRLALEFEVEDARTPERVAPEDWELRHLAFALHMGVAKPLRTIRGLVVDREHDRLSTTLKAMAQGIDEALQGHWLATTYQGDMVARALHVNRPSLEALVELEALAELARHVADRLAREGM